MGRWAMQQWRRGNKQWAMLLFSEVRVLRWYAGRLGQKGVWAYQPRFQLAYTQSPGMLVALVRRGSGPTNHSTGWRKRPNLPRLMMLLVCWSPWSEGGLGLPTIKSSWKLCSSPDVCLESTLGVSGQSSMFKYTFQHVIPKHCLQINIQRPWCKRKKAQLIMPGCHTCAYVLSITNRATERRLLYQQLSQR